VPVPVPTRMMNDDLIDDGFLTGITQTSWFPALVADPFSYLYLYVSTTESDGFWKKNGDSRSMRHDNAFVSL